MPRHPAYHNVATGRPDSPLIAAHHNSGTGASAGSRIQAAASGFPGKHSGTAAGCGANCHAADPVASYIAALTRSRQTSTEADLHDVKALAIDAITQRAHHNDNVGDASKAALAATADDAAPDFPPGIARPAVATSTHGVYKPPLPPSDGSAAVKRSVMTGARAIYTPPSHDSAADAPVATDAHGAHEPSTVDDSAAAAPAASARDTCTPEDTATPSQQTRLQPHPPGAHADTRVDTSVCSATATPQDTSVYSARTHGTESATAAAGAAAATAASGAQASNTSVWQPPPPSSPHALQPYSPNGFPYGTAPNASVHKYAPPPPPPLAHAKYHAFEGSFSDANGCANITSPTLHTNAMAALHAAANGAPPARAQAPKTFCDLHIDRDLMRGIQDSGVHWRKLDCCDPR